jgi:nitrogen fixation NifU-like protein
MDLRRFTRRPATAPIVPVLQRLSITINAMASDDDQIYQDRILDHYEDPYHRGACAAATHSHEDDNPLCGDVIHVDLEIDQEGRVRSAWFDGEGCCISQAAASMLMEKIEGKSVAEVKAFGAEDMLELFGPRLTPNRQKCCLLSWRVVQTALHSPIRAARNTQSPAD